MEDTTPTRQQVELVHQAAGLLGLSPDALLAFVRQQQQQQDEEDLPRTSPEIRHHDIQQDLVQPLRVSPRTLHQPPLVDQPQLAPVQSLPSSLEAPHLADCIQQAPGRLPHTSSDASHQQSLAGNAQLNPVQLAQPEHVVPLRATEKSFSNWPISNRIHWSDGDLFNFANFDHANCPPSFNLYEDPLVAVFDPYSASASVYSHLTPSHLPHEPIQQPPSAVTGYLESPPTDSFSTPNSTFTPLQTSVDTSPDRAVEISSSSLEKSVVSVNKPISTSVRRSLAPMPPNRRLRGAQPSNDVLPRRRRNPYSKERRQETHRTRQIGSCVRCHLQRRRCDENPHGEHLPCLPCLYSNSRTKYLGCLRYKISESVLFRTSVGPYTFYQNHPMTGPKYGDFHLQSTRKWVGDQIHVLEITQDMGSVCRFEVRQFDPPNEIDAVDLKGRSMYHIPWAIADADKAALAFDKFLDDSLLPYLRNVLDESDELVWTVFHSAIKFGFSEEKPIELLKQALRLWVACRFIEGKWHCCGSDTLRAGELKNPFRSADWVSPPPYIDYQYASIIMHRILGPLRQSVLKDLQLLIEENSPKNWYTIFLVTFILLDNYERGVVFQRAFSAKRQKNLLYLDMALIRAMHSGAKAVLVYFHWCCKGNIPFGKDFDWKSKKAQKMADVDEEQAEFLVKLGMLSRQKAEDMKEINRSHNYETPYWFTSQMFEEKWQPRDTYEHSPIYQPWPPLPIFGPVPPLRVVA